ncbi:MAG: hypothetical protein ACR2OB_05520 [Solirubrobacteraceae bacterium]
MSVPAAELTAPSLSSHAASTHVLARRFAGGRLYIALGALALVIAAASLLIPSTPSYDPWAWLVWGREIVHLKLQTTGGPTWKPLPVIFTTVLAPFGSVAPDLWLVVARAGALMAVAMVFKVATRLTRQLTGTARGPVLLAGVIGGGSLAVSGGFVIDNALGYSEGLMTALVLIAVDRHLDGKRRQAFAVGFAAALDRPELWLFWGPYGLYLWWKDPGARRLVIALFGLIPVLWFLPEYWGSGHFFRGVSRAHTPRSNSPAFASCPFCSLLVKHAWPTVLLRVKVVAGIAMLAAAVGLWRTRRAWTSGASEVETRRSWLRGAWPSQPRARLALLGAGAAGLGWWMLIGVLTQAGFSGNDRYLVLGAALVAIAGGAGWGWAAQALAKLAARLTRPAIASGAALLSAVVVFMAVPPWIGAHIIDVQGTHRAAVDQALLREGAAAAVRKLGGPANVLRCGTVMTEGFQVPMLAWTLGVPTLRVEGSPTKGQPLPPAPEIIFQTRAQPHRSLLPRVRDWPNVPYRVVARTHTFRVYSRCAGNLT